MRKSLRWIVSLLGLGCAFAHGQSARAAAAPQADRARWAAEARSVTVLRDDWGIAHIHGKTDADAVFGMIYAQCEDDFNRVETNYLTSLGRTAEAEGEKAIWADLRQKIFIDPEDLKRDYAQSPAWLRKLTDAWADGLNFFLASHPAVKPRVITRFEPWMALSFTEGSIGGDIEHVDLRRLEAFYGPAKLSQATPAPLPPPFEPEPRGSNGFAIAPANTAAHHALLLINPHTSFFFRSELQMSSDEGLNAYGAVTWGQFFVYQGFNERAGWMHTSSNVDAVDEFVETTVTTAPGTASQTLSTRYGAELRPVHDRQITIPYRTAQGPAERTFAVHYTTHGPVVRAENGKWAAIKLMNIPVQALEQSFLRTKAQTYAEYRKTMELMANSSNNTVFADSDGDIAYWHGNYIPRRDTRFDFTKPVDGSDPASDWHGLLTLDEVPHLLNPASGYLFNVNDSPWNGAGASSLKKSDYPVYVERGIESARGLHAMRVLSGQTSFTLDSLMSAAYDSFLPWFARTVPGLLAAWDALPESDPQKPALHDQIALLRTWDMRWSAASVSTSLAVFWGTEVLRTAAAEARRAGIPSEEYVAAHSSPATQLTALQTASAKLTADFGTWNTPWGDINRFQRLNGEIQQPFDDAAPSIPVPFTSSLWGSLASFGAHAWPGTRKWYGTSGNSFVAVVEFGAGPHGGVRARAVTAGGESGHPESKHFNDEATRYAAGYLREVYFYPEQWKAHTERVYHPGE